MSDPFGASDYCPETFFGARIGKPHRLFRMAIAPPLEAMRLAASQAAFLVELFREEGQIQDQLSARLHIDKAATTRTLHQLENSGFVVRYTNPDNRRQKRAFLTAKARDLEGPFLGVLQGVTTQLPRGFSRGERASALTLLDRMLRNLEPLAGTGRDAA